MQWRHCSDFAAAATAIPHGVALIASEHNAVTWLHGRLHPEKGPDLLVEALAQTRIAATELAVRVRALGLDASVRLAGWTNQAARYVAGAAVHVLPSREEAWSQSAVVGLGLGVPVIGTAVEGLPITPGEGRGILVPPEDPSALANAIDLVLDGSLRPDPAAGRSYARQFSVAAVAASYAGIYESVFARGRS